MKKFTQTLLLFLLTTTLLYGQAFVTTWKTDNPGTSGDTEITVPTFGTGYNYTVDWGDGNSDTGVTGNITHTYASAGTYTVSISGDFPRIFFNSSGDKDKLMTIEQWGDIVWSHMDRAFYGCSNMTMPATDVPNLTNVTSMFNTFNLCSVFNGDISGWDVSNVTIMASMFRDASVFNQPLNNWDVSKVTNMFSMFEKASAFNQPLNNWDVSNVSFMNRTFSEAESFNQDIGNWDVSNVTTMNATFRKALAFNQPLNNWDVAKVTDMQFMFREASAFNQPLNDWDVSKVTNMTNMFSQVPTFNQLLNNWDVSSVENMSQMFANCNAFNQDLNSWDVSNVTDMSYMFTSASHFNGDIGNWDVSNVTNMEGMLSRTEAFNNDIGAWDVSGVTNMIGMFNFPISDNPAFNQDIGDWDVSNVTSMRFMFTNCNPFNQDLSDWDVSNVTDMSALLNGTFFSTYHYDKLLTRWSTLTLQSNVIFGVGTSKYFCHGTAGRDILINTFNWTMVDGGQNCKPFITTWKTDNLGTSNDNQITIPTEGTGYNYSVNWGDGNSDTGVTGDVTHTYASADTYTVTISGDFPRIYFNHEGDAEKLTVIQSWGDIAWTSMERAFDGCKNMQLGTERTPNLSNVTNTSSMFAKAATLNRNLDEWDVSNVTNMAAMFFDAEIFNGDISTWDVSEVQDMRDMFRGTKEFNQNINDWDVSKVEDMRFMFYLALLFNQDVSNWDVSKVTRFDNMFNRADAFNQDIGGWDVSSGTNMFGMFYGTLVFDQDLSGWDVSNVTDMTDMLGDGGLSMTNYDLILNAWSSLSLQSNVKLGATSITYCDGASGRDVLVNTFNWIITDGGEDCINTEMAQTLSFGPIENQFFETGSINLTATSSSGLPVVFEIIDGPASIDGSTLTMTATGQVTVKATQPGDATYAVAAPVEQSFEIILVTGVPELRGPQFKFYPNPIANILTVIPNGLNNQLTVLDTQGRNLTSGESNSNEAMQLDLSALPRGIYILQISNESGVSQTKILKK